MQNHESCNESTRVRLRLPIPWQVKSADARVIWVVKQRVGDSTEARFLDQGIPPFTRHFPNRMEKLAH